MGRIAIGGIVLFPLLLAAETSQERRLSAAATVLSEVVESKDGGIPQYLLDRSQCVVVVPGMKKGAFLVGAKYGRGFVTCRRPEAAGWSAPAAIRIEGGSFGAQIGGKETDVVLLVLNERGADRLMSSKFTLGGQASVAAGPVGRTAAAQTDAFLTAEMLSYSRSRGLFAGLSLNGATLREDRSANQAMYGRGLSTRDIVRGDVKPTEGAGVFMTALDRTSAEGVRSRSQDGSAN
jgi:lipid-binding SYLF domain-containing protein